MLRIKLVVQAVLGSPHVSALRAEADGWHRRLGLFSEVIACVITLIACS